MKLSPNLRCLAYPKNNPLTVKLHSVPEIALYQPDIPQNTGTIIRLATCFGTRVHLIEPLGFVFSNRSLKRAGMDYLEQASIIRHSDWPSFNQKRIEMGQRLVLFTTKAECNHIEFEFQSDDLILMGRESAGVPEEVHSTVDARLKIPMVTGMRSLNVAVATAIALGEAYRQTDSFSKIAT